MRVPDARRSTSTTWSAVRSVRGGARAGLRHRARQRRTALHPGQPGRRLADGDHPRAPRRGPAAVHPAADRALRRAGRRSGWAAAGRRSSATCRPCSARATAGCRSGTRDRGWPSTSSRATCPRGCSTTWPCSAGRSPRTATSSRLAEMVEAFDILRVNANPARFDAKKCEAINAAHIRLLDPKELAEQLVPFLVRAGLVSDPPTPGRAGAAGGRHAADPGADHHPVRGGRSMLGFLFLPDAEHRDRAGRRADGRLRPGPGRRGGGPAALPELRPRRDRGGAADRAGRAAGPEAAAGLRPGPGRDHRSPDLAAAVRVDRAAGPRVDAGPDRRGPGQPWTPESVPKSRKRSPANRSATREPSSAGRPTATGRVPPAGRRPATGLARSTRACCRRTARRTRRSCAARATSGGARCSGVVFGLSMFLLLTAVVSQAVVTLVWVAHRRRLPLRRLLPRGVRLRAAGRHAGHQPRASPP